MRINVSETLAAGKKAEFNGMKASFVLVTSEASVKPAGDGAAGRIAKIGDVVMSYQNDDGKRKGAIFPLVAVDGRLTVKLKNEALGYDRDVQIGGSSVQAAISNVSSLYGLMARTNEALRENADFEAEAVAAAATVEEPEQETEIQILASMRDAMLRQADNFVAEREEVSKEPGLSAADLERVIGYANAIEKSLDATLNERNVDPKDASAINDHRSRMVLNPSMTMTADDVDRVRKGRALREQIALMTPDHAEARVYTHILPSEKIDPEVLDEAWANTREFIAELKLRSDVQPRHERGMSMNMEMADQTFARWTTVPGRQIPAFAIGGDQRRALDARLRNSEVLDSPNLTAVKAFRDVVNPEYQPEERVFKARDTVVLLVDDHHGTKVYAYPEITETEIDLDKPAFSPFTPEEIMSDDQLKDLAEVVDQAALNDVRDIEMDDF